MGMNPRIDFNFSAEQRKQIVQAVASAVISLVLVVAGILGYDVTVVRPALAPVIESRGAIRIGTDATPPPLSHPATPTPICGPGGQ